MVSEINKKSIRFTKKRVVLKKDLLVNRSIEPLSERKNSSGKSRKIESKFNNSSSKIPSITPKKEEKTVRVLQKSISFLQSIPRAKHSMLRSRRVEDFTVYTHESPTRSLKKYWNTENEYFVSNTTKNSIGLNPSRFSFPLRHAVSFLRTSFSTPRPYTVVFVGSDGWTGELAASTAYKCKQAFVNIKWVPGLLTNWSTTYNSLQNFKKVADQIKRGVKNAWEQSGQRSEKRSDSVDLNFTIHKLNHLYERYSKFLTGLKTLSTRPSLLIVLDTDNSMSAIREAQRCGIPVIALVGGSCPLSGIDYPIPCLSNSKTHVHAIANILADVITSSSKSMPSNQPKRPISIKD